MVHLQLLNHIPNSQARLKELHRRLHILEREQRVQLLLLTLDDPYPAIRHDVAKSLHDELDDDLTSFLEAVLAGKAPAEELFESLQIPRDASPHDSLRARIAACIALEASPRQETTLPIISELFSADSADLRYHAVIAFHHLAEDPALLREKIRQALGDEDPEIIIVASQIAVHRAFGDLLSPIIDARQRLRGEERLQLSFSIGELIDATELSPQALPAEVRQEIITECAQALRHEPLTAAAARTLAHLNAREATTHLERLIGRLFIHPILKVDAAAALISLGHPAGEEYIGQALRSRRKDARGYALRIVGERRLSRYFDELVQTASRDTYHADTAVLALADFGGPQAHQILTHLKDSHPDPEIRELASETLQLDGTPSI